MVAYEIGRENRGSAGVSTEESFLSHSSAPFSGDMTRRVEEFDWSSTSLGARADWCPELRTFTRHILESHFPAAIVWGKELVTIYNDAFLPILGAKTGALGRSFADIWSEVWFDIGPIADRALAGQATYIEDFPLMINRRGNLEQAFFTFCYSPLRLSDGTVAGFMDTVVETTATVRAQAELAMVNQELAHRLKNSLALVQSIGMQTLKGVQPREPVTAFLDRIRALSRAHDVLLNQNWSAVPIEQIARQTLQPLDGLSQITVRGPDVKVGSHATLSLSLLLHELATNAAKYGALKVPDGCIDLNWSVRGDMLHLSWRERDGPHVQAPTHTGFGSRLIERCFGPASKVSRQFLEMGFATEVVVPLRELAD